MDCHQIRDLVSARLDGRVSDTEDRLLDLHLEVCPACREFDLRAWTLHRTIRLRPVLDVPDLAGAILTRARRPRATRLTWIRVAMAWVGVAGIARSLPQLLVGSGDDAVGHLSRHVGALNLALFAGFLIVAWRPHRAYALLPVAGVLVAAMALGATVDIATGAVRALPELSAHLIDVAGVVFLWLLAGSPRPWRRRWVVARPTS
ncbi:MAG: zf-HC2 domain-containing protein [Microthrixaceae bacterium]|nr:zf-HC2 domain-containing protein [Microthrixaceae bacterium]